MADMRTMIEDEPSPRSSRVTRQALTVPLVKPGRPFLGVPAEEFVQGHVVDPFRDRRADAVQNQALDPPSFRRSVNYG